MPRPLLAAALAAVVCGCGADPTQAPATPAGPKAQPSAFTAKDWPMFGRVPSRTSATGAIGITATDAPRLKRHKVDLPGVVDSSPVFLHDVEAGGAKRDVFLVNTTYGRVVAVDANTAKIVWTFTPKGIDGWKGSYRITNATPAVSTDRRFVYSGSPNGKVHKLSITDGAEQGGRWPVTITSLPEREKITPSFGLIGGRLIVGTGGYNGDEPPYIGHIVAIDPGDGHIIGVTNSLCADRHEIIEPKSCKSSDSAFWARSGAVQLPDKTLVFATGNAPFDGKRDFGDSVIRVSADARKLLGSWTPSNYEELNNGDVDLGSTGPVVIGGGSLLQSGKDGELHVFAITALNRKGTVGHERQNIPAPAGDGVFTAPAVWRHGKQTWVFVANFTATAGYTQSSGRLHKRWEISRAGTSPIVAGGLLWIYDPGGALVAYRPTTGAKVASLPAGSGHWNSPVPGIGVIALPEGDANQHTEDGVLNLYSRP
jgi:hypothetical protein